ncbi:MAG: hypothetical protein Q4G60_10545 [bacterium]|nr:hypothetical protein [bacterium]
MVTGACPYCGQFKNLDLVGEYSDELTDDKINDMVMMQCDCPEAYVEQKRRKKIEKAEKDIDGLFGEQTSTEDIKEILKTGLVPMVDHRISKLTVERGTVKAKLSETSKGGDQSRAIHHQKRCA